jgi:adenosylcobinamide kinase / adenosylcobinamide-phosphate guanylyltransferase
VTLVLLVGGARSGKSRLAQQLAARRDEPVVFLATGEAGDDEMAERIERHRRERPASWRTVEEPLDLVGALQAVEPDATLVVDCLSFWTANVLERNGAEAVERDARAAAAAAGARQALTVAVTNEVGLGVVPATALGRAYRDVLGRVNAIWADAADRSFLVVAGRALELGDELDV